MAATNTAFIFFNSFKRKLGEGSIVFGTASRFWCELHSSAAGLSANSDLSTWTSIGGTTSAIAGSAPRSVASNAWSNISAAPSSQFSWNSDAIVWTVSAGGSATVKFAVFIQSSGTASDTGIPIGYVGLVAADTVVNGGNTITLTPQSGWFKMSG